MDQYNPPGPRAITLNQPVPGELTTRTYDLWSFSGNAGDRIRMFLSSDAFDSYLLFGRMVNGVFTPIETDDDGGGNLNSLIVYRLEEAGEYVVRAQSLGGRSHGAYQLSVSTYLPASATPVRIRDEGNATVIVDALSESSPADEEFNFYQDYEFRARNGRAYVAHVYSTEFSPILELGQLQRAAVNPVDFYTDESERERGRVEFTANNDGLYVLRVRASGSRPGEFQLMITEAPRE